MCIAVHKNTTLYCAVRDFEYFQNNWMFLQHEKVYLIKKIQRLYPHFHGGKCDLLFYYILWSSQTFQETWTNILNVSIRNSSSFFSNDFFERYFFTTKCKNLSTNVWKWINRVHKNKELKIIYKIFLLSKKERLDGRFIRQIIQKGFLRKASVCCWFRAGGIVLCILLFHLVHVYTQSFISQCQQIPTSNHKEILL